MNKVELQELIERSDLFKRMKADGIDKLSINISGSAIEVETYTRKEPKRTRSEPFMSVKPIAPPIRF
jgi:hypothetical protein